MKFRVTISVNKLPDFIEAEYAVDGTLYRVADNGRSEIAVDSINYVAFSETELGSIKTGIRNWAKHLALGIKKKVEGDTLAEDYDFEV